MNDFFPLLYHELNQISPIDENVVQKLLAFLDFLLEANKSTNLTAITDYQEALIKHIFDSLVILNRPEFVAAQSLIDVGSGAGIPGIPLAIAQPTKKITLLEATQKKVNFQRDASQYLGLQNTIPLWGRAEEVAHLSAHRESYDLAIGRAVSAANVLAELTLPFVRTGGFVIFYKGQDYPNELQHARYTIDLLGGKFIDSIELFLPFNYGMRSLLIIQKIKSTPTPYPRKPGTPQKKPLIK